MITSPLRSMVDPWLATEIIGSPIWSSSWLEPASSSFACFNSAGTANSTTGLWTAKRDGRSVLLPVQSAATGRLRLELLDG